MKKKYRYLQEKLADKFGPEVDDCLILENVDQAERDLVDFV